MTFFSIVEVIDGLVAVIPTLLSPSLTGFLTISGGLASPGKRKKVFKLTEIIA